jgi:hypothetical protein
VTRVGKPDQVACKTVSSPSPPSPPVVVASRRNASPAAKPSVPSSGGGGSGGGGGVRSKRIETLLELHCATCKSSAMPGGSMNSTSNFRNSDSSGRNDIWRRHATSIRKIFHRRQVADRVDFFFSKPHCTSAIGARAHTHTHTRTASGRQFARLKKKKSRVDERRDHSVDRNRARKIGTTDRAADGQRREGKSWK